MWNDLLELGSRRYASSASYIVSDPVGLFLIDGNGRRLGYTQATGAVTEIPDSFWLGDEEGIGYIPNTVQTPVQLELTGLGEDYFISVALETEQGQAFLESEGFLAAGEQLTLDVPVNTAPLLDLNGDADDIDATASISDNGGTFPLLDNNLTISDSESQNLAGATVTIQNPLDSNSELLAATTTGNITVNYDADTSTLTLSGSDTIVNYQQVLSSVTYTNNAANPDTTPREISFVVDDGASFNNFSPVATVNTLFLPDGSSGQQTFTITKNSGTTTILNFGGVGTGTNPDSATLAQVDTLKFNGSGLTAKNLVLTQSDNDLELNFKGVDNTEVVLTDFVLEELDNLSNQIGNILFNGQSTIQDSIDVFDPQESQNQVFASNKITFLDGEDNSVRGLNNSNDVINGLNGDDLIQGQSGNDILDGGKGKDTLRGDADKDTLIGGEGDDNLIGNGGDDKLNGGAGSDRIFIYGNDNITLTNTQVTGEGTDTLISIEDANLYGGNGDNLINATNASKIKTFIQGNDGNDTLRGGAKNDGLQGNAGNDNLIGNAGDDKLNGGAGSDRIFITSDNDITLTNTQVTGEGTDTLISIEDANLYGGGGDNLINATNASKIKTFIQGNDGNDTLRGGAKNDGLQGNAGND
ncbi:MAG: calcium-binding protein, partial [Cyanobacteria bacterium P01_G01_bin.67]